MGYSQEAGYIPVSIETILDRIRLNVNTIHGTTYTTESFVGSGFYKTFYALAQRIQEGEVKTSEIFLKLQQFIGLINDRISRPVGTPNGLIDKFAQAGFIVNPKPMIEADAGKLNLAVDVDPLAPNFADVKLEIGTLMSTCVAQGIVSIGAHSQSITYSNGQSADFKFHTPDLKPVLLRLTITLSENNQIEVGSPDDSRDKLFLNINTRYRLGKNFEPQKYFSVLDAPWASQVLLEYSLNNGSTWSSTVFDAEFDELFDYGLEDISIVEN